MVGCSDLLKKIDSLSTSLKLVADYKAVDDATNFTVNVISEFLLQVWTIIFISCSSYLC